MRTALWVRFVLDIALAVVIIHGWWFIAAPLAIGGVYVFPYFAEAVLAGIAYDALFGLNSDIGTYAYAGTLMAILLLTAAAGLRRILRR